MMILMTRGSFGCLRGSLDDVAQTDRNIKRRVSLFLTLHFPFLLPFEHGSSIEETILPPPHLSLLCLLPLPRPHLPLSTRRFCKR